MTAYSSTDLHVLARHCPEALRRHLAGDAPFDREHFAVGIAAHAIRQGMAYGDAPHDVAAKLVSVGRSYRGRAEPPLSPSAVAEGLALAVDWPDESDAGGVELPLGVDGDWRSVAYDAPTVRYRGVLDGVRRFVEITDDVPDVDVLEVYDWKSAWSAGEADCLSLQMRGYAVLALSRPGPSPDVLRLTIRGLRSRRSWSYDLWLDAAGLAILDLWRDEIRLACLAADAPTVARPGAGCGGCPYLGRCDAAASVGGTSPDEMAVAYAVHQAEEMRLGALLRGATAEGPIRVHGGEVGTRILPKREVPRGAWTALAARWHGLTATPEWEATVGSWLGLLAAMRAGTSSVDGVAKALTPRKPGPLRDEIIESATTTTTATRFGMWRDKSSAVNADAADSGEGGGK